VPRRNSSAQRSPDQGLLSIGALSAATGIPVDTIRTWERRYGFPVAERKPSGHRVYALATVPRLQRVAQAIGRGHRAAEVLAASDRALESLLATIPEPRVETENARNPVLDLETEPPEELLDLVRQFDGDGLRRRIEADWARLGPLLFLERRATPLLRAVGSAWAKGSLDVRHEHFATTIVGDFLRRVRLPLEERARGPVAALTTLPGELHGLGLEMAALVFALGGWRSLLLGVNTPITEIAPLAREVSLSAVAVSCVHRMGDRGVELLRSLRRRLPRQVPLLAGGTGIPASLRMPGIQIFEDLMGLDQWLRNVGTPVRR
jgi:MerR family transcriptional regulator, light-induced transcriptional regulator